MKRLNLTFRLCVIAVAVSAAIPALAMSNAEFDARAFAQVGAMQRQNANAQTALRQQHLRQNYPRLIAGYRQYLASGQRGMSFEAFCHWDLMSAAGTNVQGALDAQRRQYAGIRQAHETVMAGNTSYNAGSATNSARTAAAANNYSIGAIRGQAAYATPRGGSTLLPYYSPAGQVVNNGGNYYSQDKQGNYHQWQGNGWTRMNVQ